MMSRRNWQLQNLGITKLALRRPNVLRGEVSSFIPANIRLIVVTKEIFELNDIFINDVFRVLQINHNQVLQLTPDRATMFLFEGHCNSWQIGVTIDMALNGSTIISSSLYELKNNPSERAYFWKQICTHEYDFFQ